MDKKLYVVISEYGKYDGYEEINGIFDNQEAAEALKRDIEAHIKDWKDKRRHPEPKRPDVGGLDEKEAEQVIKLWVADRFNSWYQPYSKAKEYQGTEIRIYTLNEGNIEPKWSYL